MKRWPLTSRGLGLLLAAAGSWVMSRMFGVRELAMAAVAALALVGLALLMTRLLSTRLAAHRRIAPAHLQIGDRSTVTVTVRNTGRLRTATLWVDDHAPAVLAASSRFTAQPLSRGETVQLRYGLQARRRGLFTIGPMTVDLRDPFGIARRPLVLGATDEVVVYPRILPLTGGPPLAGHLGSGTDGAPRPGPTGEDLATIREYVHGDDLRRVHWRSTAHRGRLMVRQEENRQRPEAVVMIDCSPDRHIIGPHDSTFETMVTAAASVLWFLESRRFRLRLIDGPLAGAPRPLTWQQTATILATVDTTALDTELVWQQLERGTAGEGSLVAIVPTPDASLLRTMVRAGRTFGARVAILVDAPASTPRMAAPRTDAAATAAALATAGWHAAVVRSEDDVPGAWLRLSLRTAAAPSSPAAAPSTPGTLP